MFREVSASKISELLIELYGDSPISDQELVLMFNDIYNGRFDDGSTKSIKGDN